MAVLNNSSQLLEERQYLREGETEISERAFNLIIGGVLLWGFLLNCLMVTLFGVQINRMVSDMGVAPFLIGYFVLVIAGSVMIGKGGAGLSFLGYNLIALPIGVVVCGCVDGIPAGVVQTAVLVTAIVSLSFMILATLFPDFFLGLGRVLFVGLAVSLVAELVTMLVFRRYASIYEWIFVAIFSLYIGYDWQKAQAYPPTLDNAVDSAADIYVDIVNLFVRLLAILGRSK